MTYAYAANNPLRYTDPDGLDFKADKSCEEGIRELVDSLKKSVAAACSKLRTTCLKLFDEAGLTDMIMSKEDLYIFSCAKVVPAQPGEDGCGFANATWDNGDEKSATLATGNKSCIVAKSIVHELGHLGPTGIEHPDALARLIFGRIRSCVGAVVPCLRIHDDKSSDCYPDALACRLRGAATVDCGRGSRRLHG